ncbi:hypothetical protein [Polyangium jinanense]|uniref:Lipoprotein n=1 Tax=Polyangium jinanense TaxID=2829994 RepID=A0A9X4ARH5_9BACT|nr:hypothetical protein [Polyangium jinanense]MDC3978913.1 hypothetical protein [Polyangium jinanense]MDC3982084.1 hypothetical protein [Polyangium jinanense]
MSKTTLTKAGSLAFTFPLLLAASTMACVGVDTSENEAFVPTMADTESARLNGDGDFYGPSARALPEPEARDNSAPCGDQTLAVVHARSGATYVFCAMGNGKTGVLEELPADGSAVSVLDTYTTPTEVLRAVAPENMALPDDLVAAVDRGARTMEEYRPLKPFTLGVPKTPSPMTMVGSYYCDNPTEWSYTYGWNNSFVPFIEEYVEDYADCSLHLWTSSDTVTAHQHTASTNPVADDYGPPYATACAAKEHVLSCNGQTLFEAFQKETPSDPWETKLTYWVSDGGVATWKLFASDCQASHDRDDMRYKGTSEPGAYHKYSNIFIKWLGGTSCVFK